MLTSHVVISWHPPSAPRALTISMSMSISTSTSTLHVARGSSNPFVHPLPSQRGFPKSILGCPIPDVPLVKALTANQCLCTVTPESIVTLTAQLESVSPFVAYSSQHFARYLLGDERACSLLKKQTSRKTRKILEVIDPLP